MDHQGPDNVGERIAREHAATARLVDALSVELDQIIESVSLSNNDDEHDPDGATSGYERAKATAMLRRAEERLIALDRAAQRLGAGTYGQCECYGGEIGVDRLDALVDATRCRLCAAKAGGR